MIKIEKKGVEYELYTEEEFKELGHGRVIENDESVSAADYIKSIDGYYVPIIKVYCLNKKQKRFYYNTPLGIYFPFTGKGVLHTDKEKFQGGMKTTGKFPLTDKQRKFAVVYAQTWDKERAYNEAYGTRNTRQVMRNEANKLLKMEKVRTLVDKLTKQAMLELEVDHEWILGNLKRIVEKGDNDAVKLSAIKEFIDIMQMKTKMKVSTTRQLPISKEEILEIAGTPTKKLAEYTVTEEVELES